MAAVAGSGERKEGEAGLEDQIVQTNPILEAWGNAKTIRNNNSSRFGKFIRVHFGNTGKLSGGDIEVYLLEKSRVVYQLSAERNYHIFYQIMYSKQPQVLEMCMISDNPKEYFWAGQMGVIVVDNMDDTFEFNCTTEAFQILGFSNDERDDSYKISCAVIMMGDMKYAQKPRDEQAEVDTLPVADKTSHLLGIGSGDMCKAFTRPRIKVGTEMVTKGQNVQQCTGATGAIAKAVFDKLFQWLVKMCNRTLDTDLPRSYFCGVLDIAGFEIFDFNTFEQLCINFTNEKLQQFFNHNMFVLEQEEYMREGIEWEMMNFGMDLQACIDLLEKPMGVFAILEEQSIVPKATDETFKQKLYETHEKKNPAFVKPKVGKKSVAHFICKHYAGDVGYNLDGWLDKNKDPLNPSVVELLQKSKWGLVKVLFPMTEPEEPSGGKKKKKKKGGSMQTVGSLYRQQLNALMTTLRSTKPSFVRCIVPNEIKTPAVVLANLILHQLRCNGVLEGIRICRKGFPNRCQYAEFFQRYKILAAAEVGSIIDSKAATEIILKKIELNEALFKIGHTKVFFKAGTLADLEDLRDECLAVVITKLQARARGKLMRIEFLAMLARVRAARCIQKNIRKFLGFRDWSWWNLFTKVKPLLKNAEAEAEAKAKEAEMMEKMAKLEKDAEMLADLEKKVTTLSKEKADLTEKLARAEEDFGDKAEVLEAIQKEKVQIDLDLLEAHKDFEDLEAKHAKLQDDYKKLEGDGANLADELATAGDNFAKLKKDKEAVELKNKGLTADLEARDGSIASLQNEKKRLEQTNAATLDDLQAMEDKANHLGKTKTKLEQTIEEGEDMLAREKKLKADLDKAKRKLESEHKTLKDNYATLEGDHATLGDNYKKKDIEYNNLSAKYDDHDAALASGARKYKELNAKYEDLESEFDNERAAKQKVEKARNDLVHEMQTLTEQLEEAGGATAAQVDLIKRRDADFAKLKKDFDDAVYKADQDYAALKKKNAEAYAELEESFDNLGRVKGKLAKEKDQLGLEFDDLTAQYDDLYKKHDKAGKAYKTLDEQFGALKAKYDEQNLAFGDLTAAKGKLFTDYGNQAHLLEEAESKVAALTRAKASLAAMVEQLKNDIDEGGKGKSSMNHALQAARHDLDLMHEQLEEEQEAKSDLQRALSKSNAEVANWRSKYENDAIARMEELEEAKKKLAVKLQDAEEQTENALSKFASLEKKYARQHNEYEDLFVAHERQTVQLGNLDKKQRNFDKDWAAQQSKYEELYADYENNQKDYRNLSTDHYKLKQAYDERGDEYATLKKEWKNLYDENADLADQLSTGGKSLYEIGKAKKKAEAEYDEMKSALEEAEGALELEESRVLRLQLELTQVKAEVDKKLHEKDEEFESTRKNHARALESMQATLDVEVKARADSYKAKKNLEAAHADLEMQYDISQKNYADGQKNYKKLQGQYKDLQDDYDAAGIKYAELHDQYAANERKYGLLFADWEEVKGALDTNEKSRKAASDELINLTDAYQDLNAKHGALSAAKRKIENDWDTMHNEWEDAQAAAKSAEDAAKKAMADAAKMAEDFRAQQNTLASLEKVKKTLEGQNHDLAMKLDDAEAAALKGSKKAVAGLKAQYDALYSDYESQGKDYSNLNKNYRRQERKLKELTFQHDEDSKNNVRMGDLVSKLQGKLKQYKLQAEDAEALANDNLLKYRKVTNEYSAMEERAEMAESALYKMRMQNRK
jgi:myosin heavy subunit